MKKLSCLLLVVLALTFTTQIFADEPSGAVIVKKFSAVNQTGSIGTTTLYTPTADGDFDVSVYMVANSTSAGGASFDILWTDEYRANILNLVSVSGSSGNQTSSAHKVMHVTAGNPIQIDVNYSAGGIAYDIFIVLTKQ